MQNNIDRQHLKKVGIVGWRGMVGQILMNRMLEQKDFDHFTPYFFSTSQQGQLSPDIPGHGAHLLKDAKDIGELAQMDIILTTQGSDFTKSVFDHLRQAGWHGYWIDAASHLRMNQDSTIVLDPLNASSIKKAIDNGCQNYIGGNCTVSLMLLAVDGLIQHDLIEWISVMTYQAISGSGAKAMKELLAQKHHQLDSLTLEDDIIQIEQSLRAKTRESAFPSETISQPLSANLLPWIDDPKPKGQTKEEWKAINEANKILNRTDNLLPIDGTCVRVPSLRSHSQALTIKLKQDLPLNEIEQMLRAANEWIKFVPNEKEASLNELTPLSVSGTLDIAIGRVRKSLIGPDYLNLFTSGDQLLWGAAEPLRRCLRILLGQF